MKQTGLGVKQEGQNGNNILRCGKTMPLGKLPDSREMPSVVNFPFMDDESALKRIFFCSCPGFGSTRSPSARSRIVMNSYSHVRPSSVNELAILRNANILRR
jgi:hypothetical protein